MSVVSMLDDPADPMTAWTPRPYTGDFAADMADLEALMAQDDAAQAAQEIPDHD